jgi:hypothetical protein
LIGSEVKPVRNERLESFEGLTRRRATTGPPFDIRGIMMSTIFLDDSIEISTFAGFLLLTSRLSSLLSISGVLEVSDLLKARTLVDMAICTRTGCGKPFDENNNNAGDCMFHPGGKFPSFAIIANSCSADLPRGIEG